MEDKAKNLIIENISTLKEISHKFNTYQVTKIDLTRIIYFLTQFETYERVKVIIELLKNIDFIDSTRMTFLLKKAYDKLEPNLLQKPLISSLGGIQDSSAVVCYQLLKQLFDKEEDTLNQLIDLNSIGNRILNDSPTSIIFFDDNITSGTQLFDFFQELIVGKENAELIKYPLTREEYESLKKIPIRICYAIQLSEECIKNIERIKKDYNLDIEISCGKVDFNNYLDFQSNTMQSEEEATFAQNFLKEIAKPLYDDKNWSYETTYCRLLGYGNLGKLTVFYYNVPKSLMPVFWKFGFIKSQPWFPLFPETQEQKKIVKADIKMDPFRIELIDHWILSTPLNRKPKISFGFSSNGEISQSISLAIPSHLVVENYLNKIMILNEIKPAENNTATNKSNIADKIKDVYSTKIVSEEDYRKYLIEVDNYNQHVRTFKNNLLKFIWIHSSSQSIEFLLENNGTIAATNCIVKIFYNTGEFIFNNFSEFEKPKFDLKTPKLENFDSSKKVSVLFTKYSQMTNVNSFRYHANHETFEKDKDYSIRPFNDIRIGHNDISSDSLNMTRMKLDKLSFDIQYEINYNEEADTFSGNLKIEFKELDYINDSIKNELDSKIDSIKHDLKYLN